MTNTKRYERLLERYKNGDIDRRTFLSLLGVAGLAAGVIGGPLRPISRALAADVEQIRFDGWGGVVSEAFRDHAFGPYTKNTGIEVVDGTFGGADEYLSRVKASQPGEYNLAHLSGVFDYERYHNLGFSVVLNEEDRKSVV